MVHFSSSGVALRQVASTIAICVLVSIGTSELGLEGSVKPQFGVSAPTKLY
jgi:hypothetical protein